MNPRCFDAARISLTGDREINQDRSLILSQGPSTLLVLGDGLGGHPRGEIAAQLLIDVCESHFRQQDKPLRDPEQFMLECLHKAHAAIICFGDRQQPPICPRTTAVMAVMQCGVVYWVHVGDSRLYLLRDGHVQAQTRDHSQVHYIRALDGATSNARSSITRCLGGLDEPPTITAGTPTELRVGDVLLLCSDGLWGQLPGDTIVEHLTQPEGFTDALNALADQAYQRAHPRSDNITAIGIRWRPINREQGDTAAAPDQHLDAAVQHLRRVVRTTPSS